MTTLQLFDNIPLIGSNYRNTVVRYYLSDIYAQKESDVHFCIFKEHHLDLEKYEISESQIMTV